MPSTPKKSTVLYNFTSFLCLRFFGISVGSMLLFLTCLARPPYLAFAVGVQCGQKFQFKVDTLEDGICLLKDGEYPFLLHP